MAALYEKHLGRPLSEVSHRLLHRQYTDRSGAGEAGGTGQGGAGAPEAACAH